MDFNKKYLRIPLGIILLLAMIATVAAASLVVVYETTLTGQVTVEETASDNSYEITIYETNACDHEITSIDFGSGKPGTYLRSHLYIKNTGDSYIPKVWVPGTSISRGGWTPGGVGGHYDPLDVNEVKSFSIRVYIEPDAQPGDYSGEIKIVAKAENNE